MPDQGSPFGIFADPLSSIMAVLSKKRPKNKVVAKLLALGLICNPKEVHKKRRGKGQGERQQRGRRADSDNSGDEGEEGGHSEDEDSGQLGIMRVSGPRPHPILSSLLFFQCCQAHQCGAFIQKHSSIITISLSFMCLCVVVFLNLFFRMFILHSPFFHLSQ